MSARVVDGTLYAPVEPNPDGLADPIPLLREEQLYS